MKIIFLFIAICCLYQKILCCPGSPKADTKDSLGSLDPRFYPGKPPHKKIVIQKVPPRRKGKK